MSTGAGGEPVLLDRTDGAVRTVTLNRPQKANAINRELMDRLCDTFAEPSPGERVCVLDSTGSAFCAGVDLGELSDGTDPSPFEAPLDAIAHYPLPVIAMVDGAAVAGGVELALHCDLIVAAATATFRMPLAPLGIGLSWALGIRMVQELGPALTRRMLLTAAPITAAELDRHGIVQAVEPEGLRSAVDALATQIAGNHPGALHALKSLVAATGAADYTGAHQQVDRLRHELARERATRATAQPDKTEQIAAAEVVNARD